MAKKIREFTIPGLVNNKLPHSILKGLTKAVKSYKMFYIGNTGHDKNTGSQESPFLTLERGIEEAQKYTGVGVVLTFLTEYTHADLTKPLVISTPTLGQLVIRRNEGLEQEVILPPLYIQGCNVTLQKVKLKSTTKAPRLLYATGRANVTANQLWYSTVDDSRTIVECDRNSMLMFKSQQSTDIVGKGNTESFLIVTDNSTCEIDRTNLFWFNGGCSNAVIICSNDSFIKDANWWSQGNGISVPSKCFAVDTYANMTYGDDKKFIKNSTDGTYKNGCGCNGNNGGDGSGGGDGNGGSGGDGGNGGNPPTFTEVGDIGTPGQAGFGVGVSTVEQADKCDLQLMPNGNNPLHENYGNYQHKKNAKSISVFIPPFWIKIGDSQSPRYAKYGSNCIDFKPYKEFSSEAEANAQGYFMPEGFFNKNGISGFFFDKYICSEENGIYYSIEGANPKTNVPNNEMFEKCKARGEEWNAETMQQVQAIRFISLIQAQYCTDNTNCGWWDGSDVMNYPKGNNNNGVDVDDTSVKGTGNSSDTLRTGSCTPREKTTHNGQKNGICDVNGTFYEWAWGITSPSSGFDYDTIYVKKRSVDFAKVTFNLDGVYDAFGSETHLLTLYDKMQTGLDLTTTLNENWGNNANQVLRPYNTDGSHRLCAIFPKNKDAISNNGTNMFGKDPFLKNNYNNLLPNWSGDWDHTTAAGVFCSYFTTNRTSSHSSYSTRAAAYGN